MGDALVFVGKVLVSNVALAAPVVAVQAYRSPSFRNRLRALLRWSSSPSGPVGRSETRKSEGAVRP